MNDWASVRQRLDALPDAELLAMACELMALETAADQALAIVILEHVVEKWKIQQTVS